MVDLSKPDEVKMVVLWAAHAQHDLEQLAKEGWIVLDIKNIPHTDKDNTFLHTAYTLGRFKAPS